MPRNRSEKQSGDPRIIAMHNFAEAVLATKEQRANGRPFDHGLFKMWDYLGDETRREFNDNGAMGYNQMADYIHQTYGRPAVIPELPHVTELIAFAHLCKEHDYKSGPGFGYAISDANAKLSAKATSELQHIASWRGMAKHIYNTFAGGNGAT